MRKLSLIVLLCLIMLFAVACGKDNNVDSVNYTSSEDLNSKIAELQSQVSDLQSQLGINNSKETEEMYYELEIEGETYVTQGTSLVPNLVIKGPDLFVTVSSNNQKFIFNWSYEWEKIEELKTKSILQNGKNAGEIKVIVKKINDNNYFFIRLSDLQKYGLI